MPLSTSCSQAARESERENIVIYYYFDRSGGYTPYQAICSLLRQVCDAKDIPLPKFLAEIGHRGSHVDTQSTGEYREAKGVPLANLISDFLTVQSWFRRVYISLDGLEECDDILTWLTILFRLLAVRNIRLAITARLEMIKRFTALGIVHKERVVQIEDHNSSDIRKYLEVFLDSPRYSYLSDTIGQEARSGYMDKIVRKSGMNFLSAVAQATHISHLTSLAEITDHLDKPPLELSEVMNLILSQFGHQSPERSRLARSVLYWLSVSCRPLTLRELQQAVSSGPGARIDDSNRLSAPSLIMAVCMGFVQVDSEMDRIFTVPSALPFYFYQFSSEFAEQARQYAATTCYALFESETLSHGPFTSQDQYDAMETKLPFGSYASQNWGVHLEDAGTEDMTEKILENDLLLETLSQLLHVTLHPDASSSRRFDSYPKGFGSRHFAAYFGLTTAFRIWPTREDWAVPPDSWNRSPFQISFRSPGLHERHTFLHLILEDPEFFYELLTGSELTDHQSDGDPQPEDNSQDDGHIKLFRHMSVKKLPWTWRLMMEDNYFYGCENTVVGENLRKLYEFSREEVEAVDKDGKSPLHHFAVNCSEGIFLSFVHLMHDTKGNSSSSGGDDGLDSDTDSQITKPPPLEADSLGRTALDYAFGRNILFGFILLEWLSFSPETLNRSIVIAASCGYTKLVGTIYKAIQKSKSEGENLGPGQAVIEASRRGFADVVRWLRRVGINLNIQDGEGMSPLHHAAYGRHLDTMQFLLLEGGDPNQLDKTGRSPLFCACESGSDTIITLLKEKGVSAVRPNAQGQSQLHLAAQKGNVDVTRRLLGQDDIATELDWTNLEAAGPGTQSPLHIAAQGGHDAIVKLLIEHGFPANTYDSDSRTPLSYASEGGHIQSVKALLVSKSFVGVDGIDRYGRTSLFYAASRGHTDIVTALLGLGQADPNVRDDLGKTAMIYAAQGGHIATVVVLTILTKDGYDIQAAVKAYYRDIYWQYSDMPSGTIGVDVNVRDNEGQSAVSYLEQEDNEASSRLIRYLIQIDPAAKTEPSTESLA
ncbi:putative ankyrin repeat-containing [Rosellinia necatrix]|uniref:Putative ankyrin repeat-containing n=1 Tax=Rosellinia necatrix TaxID=77044 RepID=A0A1S8A611_ROSNE|nr:putative ankyrin repeat-containing [Rosellinia necatrix]